MCIYLKKTQLPFHVVLILHSFWCLVMQNSHWRKFEIAILTTITREAHTNSPCWNQLLWQNIVDFESMLAKQPRHLTTQQSWRICSSEF